MKVTVKIKEILEEESDLKAMKIGSDRVRKAASMSFHPNQYTIERVQEFTAP